ncbi:Aminoacyl-tRNA synthetase, class Ia [Artemisia annua]|uniref:valine--tRNA ligase n=1 Tax=Artemisia annua TaxID=35608 RepID=A0A2U1MEL6_ARTAN|nr:Aminoacyl-tRNA synthetase, class Ia [Artemisia annua]
MCLGRCSRSNDVIEPMKKLQWYVKCDDMAKEAPDAVINEKKQDKRHYSETILARNEEEVMVEAKRQLVGKKFLLTQDPDVLGTWFSSGLFPLTGLGWPDETQDFKSYYPNSVLETRHGILFFWCARIVMLGIKLGGDVPFTKEKLKNSDLDPAEFDIAKEAQIDDFPNGIQQCGIDALQFSLVSYTSQAVVLVVRRCNMSSDTRVMGPNRFL